MSCRQPMFICRKHHKKWWVIWKQNIFWTEPVFFPETSCFLTGLLVSAVFSPLGMYIFPNFMLWKTSSSAVLRYVPRYVQQAPLKKPTDFVEPTWLVEVNNRTNFTKFHAVSGVNRFLKQSWWSVHAIQHRFTFPMMLCKGQRTRYRPGEGASLVYENRGPRYRGFSFLWCVNQMQ